MFRSDLESSNTANICFDADTPTSKRALE